MAEIRALQESDLTAVGTLLDTHLPSWGGDREFLASTVLDHPWAERELTSLVAIEGGDLVGFIGAQVRRLRFEDRALHGVCCSHLVVASDRRAGAAGALLLGRLLSGPQDLTWSDSASEIVARMWRTYGGHLDHTRACDWMLVLRPLRWVGSWIGPVLLRRPIGREQVPVGALPLHAIARRGRRELAAEITGEDASTAAILDELPRLSSKLRLRVDYDAEHLEHLFGQIRSRAGELACRLVRRRGRAIGWYAYLPRRARTAARVLHLSSSEGQIHAVLDELTDDARRRGVRVLAGRLEPHMDVALRRRLAAVGLAREPVLHVRDPELRAALGTSSSLLTQLDSEWFIT